MGRNIVVFSDGTGNAAASAAKTNVWRLYEALDLTRNDQIATFDDGVGTSSFKPLRYLGLALGFGVKKNVLDLYKYICRNYTVCGHACTKGCDATGNRDCDQIYAFGFSRGAFTIRMLSGLIARQGLVPYRSEEQLDSDAQAAYSAYREQAFRSPPVARFVRMLRNVPNLLRPRSQNEPPKTPAVHCKVRFLGVWDTVAAYGLPIDELTIAVDRYIWPMRFKDDKLLPNVEYARQALGLDDERRTFFPIPWTESSDQRPYGESLDEARLVQAWFAGVHANVGGGYPDDRLAYIPLVWMIEEAARRGLRFNQGKVETYKAAASTDGPIYDSRAGIGTIYRYHPRSLERLMPPDPRPAEEGKSSSRTPLIHGSVIRRMATGADHYAPVSIDTNIDVLAEKNTPVRFRWTEAGAHDSPTIASINTLLTEPADRADRLANREKRQDCLERVADLVWWRRLIYYVMLFLTLVLLFFPLVGDWFAFMSGGYLGAVLQDMVSVLLAPIRLVLPFGAPMWFDAFTAQPIAAAVFIGLLVAFYCFSVRLQIRIRDWCAAGWNDRQRDAILELDRWRKQRQLRKYKRRAVGLGVAGVVSAAIGWAADAIELRGLFQAFTWLSLAGVIWMGGWAFYLRSSSPRAGSDDIPRWVTLEFARRCRTSPRLVAAYRWLTRQALPTVSLGGLGVLLAIVLVIPLASQAVFRARVMTGYVCKATPEADRLTPAIGSDTGPVNGRIFNTSDPCWASGINLEEGGRYRIVMTVGAETDWFDRTIHTDFEGFPATEPVHRLLLLSKRWWGQNWFKPIIRIGDRLGAEMPLDPYDPLRPARKLRRSTQEEFNRIMAEEDARIGGTHRISKDVARRATALLEAAVARRRVLLAEIDAPKSGELFIYVNDAVPMPFLNAYLNNTGSATVAVQRLH